MQHTSSPRSGGAVLLSQKKAAVFAAPTSAPRVHATVTSANLTVPTFSVTRARAHAQVRASAHASAHARKDGDALRRVLDAALGGRDVRIAAVKPSSPLVRFFAWLLIPAMLIAPLAPAYANEAPLADRVAGDVAAIVADTNVASSDIDGGANVATVAVTVQEPVVAQAPDTSASPESDVTTTASDTADANTTTNSTTTDSVTSGPEETPGTGGGASTPIPVIPESDGGSVGMQTGDGGSADTTTPSADATSTSITPPVVDTGEVATTSTTTITTEDSVQTDTVASTTEDGVTPIFDVAPEDVVNNVDAIRARLRTEMRGQLRDEVRDEVKREVRREVEQEVYRGCKNLDGTGYYCIPDAKSFGAPVIANERSISVVVQPDPITGNKQIFLVRGASTIQLTHGTDDNVFPVLDPSGDTLVWQSLQNGRWQVAFAHVNETGVPKVQYLTSGENNFNPKVYAGRIVWQAWVDGNWEIFTATPVKDKIPDDALSAEHRAAGVNGDWLVKRITANNAPDMFPTVTGDTITWQAVDGGVWQVFAYDIGSGVAHRVSKPGVKSDSPKVALVWNEEDAQGQMHMVGSSVDGTDSFDLTALARRIVDNTKEQPKSPVSNTEIVVATPVVVRTESEASSTPAVN